MTNFNVHNFNAEIHLFNNNSKAITIYNVMCIQLANPFIAGKVIIMFNLFYVIILLLLSCIVNPHVIV